MAAFTDSAGTAAGSSLPPPRSNPLGASGADFDSCPDPPHCSTSQEHHRDPTGGSTLSTERLGEADVAVQPLPASGERRILLCLDEHDYRADAAVSYASYLIMPSVIDERNRSCFLRNRLHVFAHVHQDSRMPLAGRVSRALGSVPQSRSERAARMTGHCHTVAGAMAENLGRIASNVEVSVHVDDSSMTQAEAYPHFAGAFRPQYVLLSERDDCNSALSAMIGSESWRVHHSLDNTTVIIAKSNIEGVDMLADPGDGESLAKPKAPRRALNPEQGRGLYALLMVDPELNEASQRAVNSAVDMLKPEDRVLVYSCYDTPDFATAMYADDRRWKREVDRHQAMARQQAHHVAQHVVNVVGLHPDRVKVLVENEDPCKGAAKLLTGKRGIHIAICGGKRVEDESSKGPVFRGWFSHYRRRTFGTTPDYLVQRSNAPAIAVCY